MHKAPLVQIVARYVVECGRIVARGNVYGARAGLFKYPGDFLAFFQFDARFGVFVSADAADDGIILWGALSDIFDNLPGKPCAASRIPAIIIRSYVGFGERNWFTK